MTLQASKLTCVKKRIGPYMIQEEKPKARESLDVKQNLTKAKLACYLCCQETSTP